jgi:hypothetical protein
MEENFNLVAMVIIAAIAWANLAYQAGKRKGHLEGRKAVRKHYERVGR